MTRVTVKWEGSRGEWSVCVGDHLTYTFDDHFWAREFANDAQLYYWGYRLRFPTYSDYRKREDN